MPLGTPHRLFPASAGHASLLFPLVDRDGLCKPLLQIIAEDAMQSGIESIGVVVSPAVRMQCEMMLACWQGPTRLPEDWVRLQQEKLAKVAAAIQFIEASTDEAAFSQGCRAFVGEESFAFLPADGLYVSATKDRCLQQLLLAAAWSRGCDAVLAVQPVMARDAYAATIVRAGGNGRLSPIVEIVQSPKPDQCESLYTPGLPPGQYLAATGMCLLPPAIFDAVAESRSLFAAINGMCSRGLTVATTLAATHFDLQTPYGFLEAQLALGLAGIHRTEICEMIARTLADQAKN